MKKTSINSKAPDLLEGFDLSTVIEISRHGKFDRVGFSAIYAALSLLIMPWADGVAWISAIVIWEYVIG